MISHECKNTFEGNIQKVVIRKFYKFSWNANVYA